MEKLKLPRKLKKKLKRSFFLYPKDEDNCYRMASPSRIIEDFEAYKKGILRDLRLTKKADRRKEYALLDAEIYVDDDKLLEYVKDIFDDIYCYPYYNVLVDAKNSKIAKKAYYNFINAYHLYQKGDDSYSNICCMTIDEAKKNMKKYNQKLKQK